MEVTLLEVLALESQEAVETIIPIEIYSLVMIVAYLISLWKTMISNLLDRLDL